MHGRAFDLMPCTCQRLHNMNAPLLLHYSPTPGTIILKRMLVGFDGVKHIASMLYLRSRGFKIAAVRLIPGSFLHSDSQESKC